MLCDDVLVRLDGIAQALAAQDRTRVALAPASPLPPVASIPSEGVASVVASEFVSEGVDKRVLPARFTAHGLSLG